MELIKLQIKDLVFDPNNARKHDNKNLDSIKGSLNKFGQQKPIVVNKKNMIIAGNGTVAAAKELGWSEVTVVVSELDDFMQSAYALADNRTSELAEWDMDILKESLAALDIGGFDISDIGFDHQDFDIEQPGSIGNTDDDDIPEVEENIHGVVRGDIWQLGAHRLMCGDSTSKEDVERLMDGEKADMVFTDPPYGVDYTGGIQFTDDGVQKNNRKKLGNDGDVSIYSRVAPIIKQFVDGPGYIWFAFTNAKDTIDAIDAIGQIHALLIWNKTNATYGSLNANYKQRHEPCLYIKTKGSTLRWNGPTTECTVWDMKRDPNNDLHPTQKPVALAERAIGNHNAKSVLDLFLGSGSTLIACEKTNRKCYGSEIDPHYCSVIIERWQQYTGHTATKITC